MVAASPSDLARQRRMARLRDTSPTGQVSIRKQRREASRLASSSPAVRSGPSTPIQWAKTTRPIAPPILKSSPIISPSLPAPRQAAPLAPFNPLPNKRISELQGARNAENELAGTLDRFSALFGGTASAPSNIQGRNLSRNLFPSSAPIAHEPVKKGMQAGVRRHAYADFEKFKPVKARTSRLLFPLSSSPEREHASPNGLNSFPKLQRFSSSSPAYYSPSGSTATESSPTMSAEDSPIKSLKNLKIRKRDFEIYSSSDAEEGEDEYIEGVEENERKRIRIWDLGFDEENE